MKCEVCNSIKDIQMHHIKPRALGGRNNKSNLLNVCHKCHKLIHKLGILELSDINLLKERGFDGYLITKYCLIYEDKYSVNNIDYKTLLNFCNYLLDEIILTKSEHGKLVKSGLENARAKGRIGGRPKVSADKLPKSFYKYYEQWKNKEIKKIEFAKLLDVSRPTLDLYIKTYETSK